MPTRQELQRAVLTGDRNLDLARRFQNRVQIDDYMRNARYGGGSARPFPLGPSQTPGQPYEQRQFPGMPVAPTTIRTNQSDDNDRVVLGMARANTPNVNFGSFENYRKARIAQAAGMQIPSSASVFDRNAIRPDKDMFNSPGLADPAEQRLYREQTKKLEQSVLRRMARQPGAFKTLDEVDRFIRDDTNYSDVIGTAAMSLGETIIGKTAPELYQKWQQQVKVDEANKLAEAQGSEIRYELDPASGMLREKPLSPEQEHDIVMRKAGMDVSIEEATQSGMPVIQLGDKLIGPADRRYKAFTREIPVYGIERDAEGKPILDKAGKEIYAEGPDNKPIVVGSRIVPIEGAQVYKPKLQAPITPGKGFITNVATGQTAMTGQREPKASITDQQGRVVTPAMAEAEVALQNPLLSPADRAYLESKMPQKATPSLKTAGVELKPDKRAELLKSAPTPTLGDLVGFATQHARDATARFGKQAGMSLLTLLTLPATIPYEFGEWQQGKIMDVVNKLPKKIMSRIPKKQLEKLTKIYQEDWVEKQMGQ